MVLTEQYIGKGIKVVVNPTQKYFDQLQYWYSKTERWNFRPAEYKLWLTTYDKYWLLVAIDEETDEAISSVGIALQHTPDNTPLYSIGIYYCVPHWRGKGVSNKLFAMAVKLAGDNNNTLYGALLMSNLYAQRFNFSIMNDFWHHFADVDGEDLVIPVPSPDFHARKIEDKDWEKLHNYDRTICDLERKKYMRANLSLPDTVTRLVTDKNGKIVGFGCIRIVTGNELVLSPMYADNFEASKSLIAALLRAIPNLPSYDCLATIYPEVNNDVPRLLSLISNNRYESHKAYRNQYTKEMMTFPQGKIYGLDECSHSPV